MPDKEKKPDFVVTDRRLFSSEGELRQDVVEDEERRAEHEAEKREAQQRRNDEREAQKEPAPAAAATMPEPEVTTRIWSQLWVCHPVVQPWLKFTTLQL